MLSQMFSGSNAREHQQLRRGDRAGTENNFPPRTERCYLAPMPHLHSACPTLLNQDFFHQRIREDGQVGARLHRCEVGAAGTAAFAPVDGDIGRAEAFPHGTVGVVIVGVTSLLAGFDKRQGEGVADTGTSHLYRAIVAVPLILRRVKVLRPTEIGQNLGPGPAITALGGPVIVVGRHAAIVHHPVDTAGAAKNLAAWRVQAAVVQVFLRLGQVGPGPGAGKHDRQQRPGGA